MLVEFKTVVDAVRCAAELQRAMIEREAVGGEDRGETAGGGHCSPDIFRHRGPAWRASHAGHVSLGQLKVMSAIERCRTAALGGHVERCEDCAHLRISYNSCGNRHCPKCQAAAAKEWLADRQMGRTSGPTTRDASSDRRRRQAAGRRSPPDVGRWQRVPVEQG